jgi:hypothetical protein
MHYDGPARPSPAGLRGMGKIGKPFVLLTSLVAAGADGTAPEHAPGHTAAAANRPSVAGLAPGGPS